jgi:hypothetical protein
LLSSRTFLCDAFGIELNTQQFARNMASLRDARSAFLMPKASNISSKLARNQSDSEGIEEKVNNGNATQWKMSIRIAMLSDRTQYQQIARHTASLRDAVLLRLLMPKASNISSIGLEWPRLRRSRRKSQ